MIVLGISAFFHDSAAALVVDGEIVAAAQEERFSRIKHDSRLPTESISYCLAEANIAMDAVNHVVFYEKPLKKFERILVTHLQEFPRGLGQFTRAMRTWLGDRLWIKSDICRQLGCRPEQLSFSEHHLSHAASSFLASPCQSAAIVTVDGVGEWATTSIFHGTTDKDGSKIELLKELHFPHSIGLLYSAITAYLGFEVNEGEYKVMGLSAYGTPRYLAEFSRVAAIGPKGELKLDTEYFCFHYHSNKSFTHKLEQLFGPARTADSPLSFTHKDSESQRYADIAASLQAFTEKYMLALVSEAKTITGETQLCLAGGVALNSVCNRKLAEEGPFDAVHVHPAAGDAGGALGAALYVSHIVCGDPRPAGSSRVDYGKLFDKSGIHDFIHDCKLKHDRFEKPKKLADDVARRLSNHQVGGWFQGGFEWGPRSLGHRSILADPRGENTKDRVNHKVKFREGFRPFAPVVLEEDADKWFELGKGKDASLWPTMCSVVPAKKNCREQLPAVVHVDGTSRMQVVNRNDKPLFHSLLESFRELTGVGVLLNTSMNLKGEPICNSPAEAYAMFMRSDLDFLVLENCIVSKEVLR